MLIEITAFVVAVSAAAAAVGVALVVVVVVVEAIENNTYHARTISWFPFFGVGKFKNRNNTREKKKKSTTTD